MNKLAKMLVLGLALLMVFSGCSNNSKKTDTHEEDQEVMRFSVTLPANGVDNPNSLVGKEWHKRMEAYMGKKVEIEYNYIPSSEYDEKVKLMIASDDLTDFFVTPLFYDTTEMAEQGQLLELGQYKDLMPNYMNYIGKVKNGMKRVTDADGNMFTFKETSTPRFPEDRGMLIQNTSAYRYDVFEANNIKIPETLDEFYGAAKKLKELYPDKYPVATKWNSLRSLFSANHIRDEIFWDGEKYVYGVLDEGYKDALQFANKLYAEKLLDPEYTIDTDDTLKRKALNGDNLMWLTQWFTTPAEYTRTADDGKIFAVSLYPDNPKYGKAWQEVVNGNTPDLGWGVYGVSSKVENPEELIKFIDYQYSDEMIQLITWGIEGTTYTIGEDGVPTFVDSLKTAKDPWLEGDKYGMRASRNHNPGLQMVSDARAFVDFAATDYTVFNGKYEEVPIEKAEFLTSLPMPENDYVPSWLSEPSIQLTGSESQRVSEIMNPIKTFVTEEQAKFVAGKNSFDNWQAFIDKVKKMGNIDEALKIYNDAAQRALGNE
ncbi:extracellular solute-binding protein [Paenibacillus lautus]|jgi:putative aldouronate transport system substrate-binding protein|uniref:ABC transporter substrate-binding protein n=1 Tax=Paenibacillus lautus TaxID=1401 RepID=UPI0010DDB952|nr:extracellular solute-binding protein [Paenibacillus lautus]MCI1773625.1 extracellular solute-binding protein [Paenibacillus lautus]VTR18707.1 Lipoprotein lplA [Actinobacillus pleuropneumoniae]